ncbi:serine/threonine-protein kinase [Chitinimonas lacunae]|uniref:Protein kinase n=1 Tax=Chitinimonas lacunae TaxID=1963018 RepID=A0ABV8MXF5_9NEIS
MDRLAYYRITEVLGQGAMGVVYRAVDERLDRPVALKVLHLHLDASHRAEYNARLQLEARSAARLNHAAIITVYECGEIDGQSYLAMELVEGRTLRQVLEHEGRLPPDELEELARQLFDALAYAHARDVVHRDIKPANLMLTSDGRLKITDFGIAQLPSNDLTRTGALIGSPGYMAPEQIQSKRVDGRADLFAAGVVLYQAATGVAPFDSEQLASTVYRILYEEPADPRAINPAVPDTLAQLIMRCLKKDRNQRFADAEQALAMLAAPTPRPIGSQSSRRSSRMPSRRMLALAGGAALLLGGVIWWQSTPAPELDIVALDKPSAPSEPTDPPLAPGAAAVPLLTTPPEPLPTATASSSEPQPLPQQDEIEVLPTQPIQSAKAPDNRSFWQKHWDCIHKGDCPPAKKREPRDR